MHESLPSIISDRTLDALKGYGFPDADRALLQSFTDPTLNLLGGGKRVRGLLSIAGAMCTTGIEPSDSAFEVAAAVEIFQGAALVHDDIMDDSPTRRGQPAVHVAFASNFENSDLVGDSAMFGRDAGICSGDFLLALASSHMLKHASMPANQRFQTMCAEVAFGQFLDIRAENIDLIALLDGDNPREALLAARQDAFSVLRHKSARYSVRDPLLIGADAAGADETLLDTLNRIGSPLGEAFQLRDDALGVAGDPAQTGKPTGGDLREGKRTVLILTTLARLAGTPEATEIARALGQDLTDTQVRDITAAIVDCGAWDEHEELIAERERAAQLAWEELPAGPGKDLLDQLMQRLTNRKH